MVRTSTIREVAQREAFSIIVGETKDISKKEQMSCVIQYYYNGSVCESFLTFEAAESMDATVLSQNIVQTLQKYGLDYRNHLVGQAYDGASVMCEENTGVQVHIKSVAPLAFYVHCNAHCLNLVLADSVKCISESYCFFFSFAETMSLCQGIYAPKVARGTKGDVSRGPKRVTKAETRWACRYNACKTVWDSHLTSTERNI